MNIPITYYYTETKIPVIKLTKTDYEKIEAEIMTV